MSDKKGESNVCTHLHFSLDYLRLESRERLHFIFRVRRHGKSSWCLRKPTTEQAAAQARPGRTQITNEIDVNNPRCATQHKETTTRKTRKKKRKAEKDTERQKERKQRHFYYYQLTRCREPANQQNKPDQTNPDQTKPHESRSAQRKTPPLTPRFTETTKQTPRHTHSSLPPLSLTHLLTPTLTPALIPTLPHTFPFNQSKK